MRTLLVDICSIASLLGVVRLLVNAQANPSQNSIREVRAEQNIVEQRIIVCGRGLAREEISSIARHGDLVRVVWCSLLSRAPQRLVEVHLANMRDLAAGERAVWLDLAARVRKDVLMGRAPGVMPWEDVVELYRSVGASHLDATEVGCLEASLTSCRYAAVDAERVAGPHINYEVLCWLACRHVDEFKVDMHWDACLALNEVLADLLAKHIIWPVGALRRQDAAGASAEDGADRGIERVALCLTIMVDLGPLREVLSAAAPDGC
jgi:hypothetical protein